MSAHKNRYAGWRMYYEGREKSSSFRYLKLEKNVQIITGRRYERCRIPGQMWRKLSRAGEKYILMKLRC